MIDPDDLTIEPNDDATCDDYWGCDDDVPTDDTDDFEVSDDVETHQL